MRIKRRVRRVEFFVELISFISSSSESSSFFCFQNEWTFKAYDCTTLYVFNQIFYTWNLLYISKSSEKWLSFTVASKTEFMRSLRSWTFENDDQKNFWTDLLDFLIGAKTALRLCLAYRASWGVRVAYPRSGDHVLVGPRVRRLA